MMNQKQILEYAIKGINGDIEKLDTQLRKGQKMIEQYYKGEQIKSKLPIYEIENTCKKLRTEIENLEKQKDDLKWALTEIE